MSLNKSKSLRTAEKYVLQGKLPAAIDEYRKVVEADPSDLTNINTLGDLYVRTGKIEDAIRNFSRIADSYREGGFTLKAIAMLKKISKLDPTNIETAMKLANLYSQQGLLVEARQQYLQVADAFARSNQAHKALEAYQKIADLDPSNTSVRMKLGEIYTREGMREQAHDAFVMAGNELLRKNEFDQALTANLKAIAINPDSRHALTSIASIYTQQGQAERAINLLCEAFERSPGDVELLTILGRTYLSASWMDDAERTFLSLVELDRSRYHYLLEVGRRFLQMGNLDRAAEMIDGCLEILIAKREEDKAIDFLRRVLDQDLNHLGALKRLAQIFMRIREDHNLIATLNSVVEAAMKKGNDEDTIAALKELVRLEPNESMHIERLKKFGVTDVSFLGASNVVPATGMLDYSQAAYDEAFVIRQISEAEILAGHGKVDEAVSTLKEILVHAPDNVKLHLKLKDIYLRTGRMKQAAEECLALAHLHDLRGEEARASDYRAEARQLNPQLTDKDVQKEASAELGQVDEAFGFDLSFNNNAEFNSGEGLAGADFEALAPPNGFDFEPLQDSLQSEGFANFGQGGAFSVNGSASGQAGDGGDASFRYFDTLNAESGAKDSFSSSAESFRLSNTGELPTDTIPRALRDELEGIDFYIAQGYVEIARDSLDRMRAQHGDYAEIDVRYKKLGMTTGALKGLRKDEQGAAPAAEAPQSFGEKVKYPGEINLNLDEAFGFEAAAPADPASGPLPQSAADLNFDLSAAPKDSGHKNFMPVMFQKDSGLLDADLVVKFNTQELLHNTDFEALRPLSGMLTPPGQKSAAGEPDQAEVSSLDRQAQESGADASNYETKEAAFTFSDEVLAVGAAYAETDEKAFAFIEAPAQEKTAPQSAKKAQGKSMAAQPPSQNEVFDYKDLLDFDDDETELQQMLAELKENSDGIAESQDFETHYNLGLAYKDMELHDEAIEEFQMAYRLAAKDGSNQNHIQCCHMLGFCFKSKAMPKVAVMWFQRGLKIPNSTEDEYQALRFEIGSCLEEMGEFDKAIDVFMEVYGTDVNYRKVGQKIKQLQAAKKA